MASRLRRASQQRAGSVVCSCSSQACWDIFTAVPKWQAGGLLAVGYLSITDAAGRGVVIGSLPDEQASERRAPTRPVEDASCRMLERIGSDHEHARPRGTKEAPDRDQWLRHRLGRRQDRWPRRAHPASLRNEKDWDCFQRALAGSDLVVLGHRSHQLAPNVRGDQRLVISRRTAGLEQHPDVWWWNPARVSWVEVAKKLLPRGGVVAVPGGQGVFDLFLKIGFDAFHLTRAHGVRLPGGERFSRVATLVSQPRPYSPAPDCAPAK
jgi:hypothetical protein